MAKIQIPFKLALAFTAVSVITLLVSGIISYRTARRSLEVESFNKLTAIREMKAQQVESYFEQIRNQVKALSVNGMIVDAARQMRSAFHGINAELDIEIGGARDEALEERLRGYYESEMLPRLNRLRATPAEIEEFWPDHGAHVLQDLYICSNPNPTGEKHKLLSADDASTYSRVHAKVHPVLRDYLERFGYYDIFIIDPSTGQIVYSVFKEVDFATSLVDGPYKDTNLADAFRAAISVESGDFAQLVDFAPYAPSYGAPAAFIASPIFDGEELVGVLALQMPVRRINDIMTSNQSWRDVGLGDTGETYLVGEDSTLRNDSRFLIEDRQSYLKMIGELGMPIEQVEQIEAFDSSIGLQAVKTPGTAAAFRGERGTRIFQDYRGVPVLSAYRPLELEDVRWVILSEIDAAEAFIPVRQLRTRILVLSVVLVAVFAFLSLLVSRTLTDPLRSLRLTAQKLATGKLETEVDTRSRDEIGDLSRSLDAMRMSIKKLVEDLRVSNETLETRVTERTTELAQAHERFQAILDHASDGVITIDAEQKIVLFNLAAERIFGWRADEIIGRSIRELVPEERRSGHDDYVRAFAVSSETSRRMSERLGADGLRRDGSTFPAEIGISKMEVQGKSLMTAFVRDVTERKRAEARLRLQSAALESAANSIVITSTDGTIEWVNPSFCGLTGFAADEVVGKTPRLLKSGQHPPEFYAELWQTVTSGKVWSGEIVNRRKDGTLYTEEMTVTPVIGGDGSTSHFVAIKQDVTKRKELEATLQEAFETIKVQKERMQDELNVAREIQMSMLPLIFPAFPERKELDVHASLLPAREVGGDFYDFFFIDERRFCFCVGDVSDKGVPAALFMAVTKTLMKSRAMDDVSTASILTHVNDELSKENDSSMFVTVFIGFIDISTGVLTYTNAGHNPPYIIRADGEVTRLGERHGPVVAALPGVTYKQANAKLSPGDQLFLYTDGVIEAMNGERELYGEPRLVEVLRGAAGCTSELTVARVTSDVKEFEAGAEQADDTTVLGLRYIAPLSQSNVLQSLQLTMKNDLTEIEFANAKITEFAEAHGVDTGLRRKLNVVLDELLNNVISYAYEDEGEHEIRIAMELAGRRLVLTISDDGIPFNAFAHASPDVEASLEDRGIGGLGIHLVRNLMDEVGYQRGIGRNIVTLVKYMDDQNDQG